MLAVLRSDCQLVFDKKEKGFVRLNKSLFFFH
jgi:hypothetical protein